MKTSNAPFKGSSKRENNQCSFWDSVFTLLYRTCLIKFDFGGQIYDLPINVNNLAVKSTYCIRLL